MIPKRILSLVVMSLLACTAFAQDVPDSTTTTEEVVLGTTSPDMLLRRGDVRDDLQLSTDQSIKILTIQSTMADQASQATQTDTVAKPASDDEPAQPDTSYDALRRYAIEQYDHILTSDQLKRLKQISLQLTGYSALAWNDVQKQVDLSKDLQIKIADLCNEEHHANESVLAKFAEGELAPEALPEKVKKNHQILNDEIEKVIPDSVKDKFKSLWGRTFKPTATP